MIQVFDGDGERWKPTKLARELKLLVMRFNASRNGAYRVQFADRMTRCAISFRTNEHAVAFFDRCHRFKDRRFRMQIDNDSVSVNGIYLPPSKDLFVLHNWTLEEPSGVVKLVLIP